MVSPRVRTAAYCGTEPGELLILTAVGQCDRAEVRDFPLTVLASRFAAANGDPKPRWAAVEVTVPRGAKVSADTAPNGTMA